MPNTKPYVAVACVCEKAIVEPDNVTSLIRIVDTFYVQIPAAPLPPGVGGVVSLTVFVSIKSGDVTGEHEVSLVLRQPTGKSEQTQKWLVVLTGGEQGANLKVDFNLGLKGETADFGLYWFDVLWGGEVLTSIPLKLIRAEPTVAPAAPSKP
jgi:hypothetical protein